MSDARYLIAIDPGKQSGVAVWDYARQCVMNVYTFNFWQLHDFVLEQYQPDDGVILIESSESQSYLWHAQGKNRAVTGKVGRSVGANNREASLLAERFASRGYSVGTVKPKNTKLSAEAVKRLSGYQGRTNNHNRDAIMICVNHNTPAKLAFTLKTQAPARRR